MADRAFHHDNWEWAVSKDIFLCLHSNISAAAGFSPMRILP
jgi:hypothetical protein